MLTKRTTTQAAAARKPGNRNGAALLVALSMIVVVTLLVVNVLDTETVEMSAIRNSIEYEKALYLANAGLHHMAAELEANPTWRTTVTSGGFPASGSYQATIVDGPNNSVIITAKGVSGGVTRTVSAVMQP